MRPLLQLIRDHRAEVVRQWYRLYVHRFGDSRSLSQSNFASIFESALERTKSALLNHDLGEFARQLISLGESLVEHRMPLEEAIAAFQMFEQSAQTVVLGECPPPVDPRAGFQKLSYLRINLLMTSYFSSPSAIAGEQLMALDREAVLLPAAARSRFCGLVGASGAMRQLYSRIEEATFQNNQFIVGEPGTCRELVARALHVCGPRARGPFVAINCAAVPAELIEDELFGYGGEGFCQPQTGHLGLLRAAEGGTLFVDQITQAGSLAQKKLARVLPERLVPPLGAAGERAANVQLIAADNHAPQLAAAEGILHPILFDKFHAPALAVPPLRERREDIPLLAEHFIARSNSGRRRQIAGVERQALQALSDYSWPGNVEELHAVIESAVAAGAHPVIELEDLPPPISRRRKEIRRALAGGSDPGRVATFADVESEAIRRALEYTRGNKLRAANLLRISRKRLYAKIEKYGL